MKFQRISASMPTHIKILSFTIETQALRAVLLSFLTTRILVFLIIFLSSSTIPMRTGPFTYASPNNLLLDGLVRYDSWWYHAIVTQGYDIGNIETGVQGNVAFFPLYPLFVKMMAAITGNVFLGGVLVSNIAFLIALAYLYALTRREFDDETAARAVFYLAAAPTAVFFSAMYTESLYIALVVATFYYAHRGQWDRAALCGALTAATRNTGILMAAVIALEGMHQHGARFRPPSLTFAGWPAYYRQQLKLAMNSWRCIIAGSLVLTGLLFYMAYLSNAFGDPLGFIHVQSTWGREVSAGSAFKILGNTIRELNIGPNIWLGQFNPVILMDTLSTLVFIPLIIAVVLKMRPAHAVFVGLTFVVPLSTGTVGSMNRYILMLIPCFMLLAHWAKRSWLDRLVLGVSLPLMAYSSVLFSHWYFAG